MCSRKKKYEEKKMSARGGGRDLLIHIDLWYTVLSEVSKITEFAAPLNPLASACNLLLLFSIKFLEEKKSIIVSIRRQIF